MQQKPRLTVVSLLLDKRYGPERIARGTIPSPILMRLSEGVVRQRSRADGLEETEERVSMGGTLAPNRVFMRRKGSSK